MEPCFTFEMYVNNKKVTCRINTSETDGDLIYEVYFDDKLTAELVANDEGTWRQIIGAPLDAANIELIGKRIEEHYA
jgi:hypothetical protein